MPQINWSAIDIEHAAMRYSLFVPRLFNLCISLGLEPKKMLPSRVFCSDESQGYPIILLTKHFGSFPFNHGRVGGIVATDRHAPFADHGEDLVIILAPHVGYDPESGLFGIYRRQNTENQCFSNSCGAIHGLLAPYLNALKQARQSILLSRQQEQLCVHIPKSLLTPDRSELLYPDLSVLTDGKACIFEQDDQAIFVLRPKLQASMAAYADTALRNASTTPIGDALQAEMIVCRSSLYDQVEGHHHLKVNLMRHLSDILCARHPLLTAALINSLVEFERILPTLKHNPTFSNKRLFLIAGINIDVSPEPDRMFPLTKFVPCAAYKQIADNVGYIDQAELLDLLNAQSTVNPHQIDLEQQIDQMQSVQEIILKHL